MVAIPLVPSFQFTRSALFSAITQNCDKEKTQAYRPIAYGSRLVGYLYNSSSHFINNIPSLSLHVIFPSPSECNNVTF
jgi:hypothetical protein